MEFELISEEEYDNLPSDDERCFVEFERIVRRNMTRMINDNTTNDFDQSVREQYMAAVSAVALECNIPNVRHQATSDGNFWSQFGKFSLAVQGEVARIRIRQRGERHPYSVLLTGTTRTKIEHYISRIREMVDHSEMDPSQKRKLNDRLNELMNELGGQRVSFAKTMAILVAVTTALAAVTTISADGPNAIAHIMALIGHDKATEEEAAKRLAPSPKALPAPARVPVQHPSAKPTTIEDDIPF